ncbi:11559_t:CDS:1, partial [Acaulospora morrowiae]
AYSVSVNSIIPDLGDLILTKVLIAAVQGLVHELIDYHLITLNTQKVFPKDFDITKNNLGNAKSTSACSDLDSDSSKSEKQTLIDRMQEENRQLLSKLADLENVFKTSSISHTIELSSNENEEDYAIP